MDKNLDYTMKFEGISEGNSSTWCSYSLDADGNLTIYASSETLEGKYNAEQDCVKLYGTNYYRH